MADKQRPPTVEWNVILTLAWRAAVPFLFLLLLMIILLVVTKVV